MKYNRFASILNIFMIGSIWAGEAVEVNFNDLMRQRIEELKKSDPGAKIIFDENLYKLLSKFAVESENSNEKLKSILKLTIRNIGEGESLNISEKLTCEGGIPKIENQNDKFQFENLSNILSLKYNVDLKVEETSFMLGPTIDKRFPLERAKYAFNDWSCIFNVKNNISSNLKFNIDELKKSNVNICDFKSLSDYIGPGHCGPGNCGPNDTACGPDNCGPNDAACGPDNFCGPSATVCGPDNCGPSDSGCGPDNCVT